MNPNGSSFQNSYPGQSNSFLNSKYFDPDFLFGGINNFLHHLFYFTWRGVIVDGLNLILGIFTIFFIMVICYCIIRLFEIRATEHAHVELEIAEYAHHQKEREEARQKAEPISNNEQWISVINHTFATNEGDWKLAIIEADSMLDKLLVQLGIAGETLGDKLKAVSKEKFRNLSTAWEVHTIRNRIAHEGSAFQITQQETKRVIALYELMFREFGYI